MGALIALILVALALLGAPLFVVLGGAGIANFSSTDTALVVLAEEHYKLATNPHLITIPLFTLSGFLMAESKAADRLVRVSRALLGWLPGGLGIVVVASCAFFTTFTGASGVTIIALGGLLFPILMKEKYPESFSLGLITSSGSIGLLFPPSLPIILYGIVAGTSIDQLFVAGIVPGMLFLAVLGGFSLYMGRKHDVVRTPFDAGEALRATWAAKWELLVPVVVIVAIYGIPGVTRGLVTIAEASAICALYLVVIEVFVYGDIKVFSRDPEVPDLYKVTREAMVMVGSIMIILGVALGLTNYLVQEEVPMKILAAIEGHIESRVSFLLLLTVFLLIVGCLMDIFSAIIVVVPLITPIAAQYDVHPVHLGVIFLANLEIGYLTPPVGLNLFISSLAFDRPVVQLYRMALPFLLLMMVALLVITFNEGLSLWLVERWASSGAGP
ncbi:TRAP transporter large permease [Paraliomyxa miuraensis]|uniref:TRAP transporter large permease n=1 Tax=Paraliomyxa miuraensis TaxID=376150 RepID=UPI00224C98F9|nr:TRAP transporter large permease [Paraliomyxa miuraensis]MCX4240977.1 TRAP transporter large permease [Paraliomyxa miuraensis]